jgi:membrane protease YdiL (CAAX protease family)
LAAVLARHALVSYFVIAYAVSWGVWIPYLLSRDGFGLLRFESPISHTLSGYLFSFGPLVSALIVTGVIDGGAGIRRLLLKMVLWRVSIWWYLFVFFGFPLLELLGTVLVPGNMASFQPMAPLPMLFSYIPFFIYPAMLVGGPLGEEPGWRGFALPRLQVRYGPLLGTLVLSPLWAIWHWPAIWATIWPQNGINFFPNIVLYLLFLTFWAVIMTWLFNNTRGSILIAILAHASVDAFPNAILGPLFPATVVLGAGGAYRGYFGLIVGLGLAALVLIAVTRGRLGYDRYQRDLAAELAGASA